MRRYGHVLAAAAVLALGVAARGEITITPSEPTEQDAVHVTVSRWTNTGGYNIENVTTAIMDSLIQVDLFWTTPRPGAPVTQALVHHKRTVSLGTLRPGLYKMLVAHRGLSVPSESASFTVSAGPPTDANPVCDCFCHRWPEYFAGRTCPYCGCPGQPAQNPGRPTLLDRLHKLLSLLPH